MTPPLAQFAPYAPLAVAVLLVLVLALTAWVIALSVRVSRMTRHYRELTLGVSGGNLEKVLEENARQVRTALQAFAELDGLARRLERQASSHLQRVGFTRFNPFRDSGGDQSFALVLADEAGNGVAVSSLHSRDVTRVYAKPLVAWTSTHQLTDEEQQAIAQAQRSY